MQKFPVCTSKENETNEDCVNETSCSENDQLMLGTVDYPQGDYVPREEIPSPQSMSVPVQEMNQGLSTRSRGRPPKTTKTADHLKQPKLLITSVFPRLVNKYFVNCRMKMIGRNCLSSARQENLLEKIDTL